VGLLAAALLLVNNLRDIPTDASTGKRTLAVRVGDRATRVLYALLLLAAFAAPVLGVLTGGLHAWALLMLAAAPLSVPLLVAVRGALGRELIPTLVGTARLHLVTGVLLTTGLALSHP
jgi:1,4-dihydroxy-2-naphthoate octaprenyltransferase